MLCERLSPRKREMKGYRGVTSNACELPSAPAPALLELSEGVTRKAPFLLRRKVGYVCNYLCDDISVLSRNGAAVNAA